LPPLAEAYGRKVQTEPVSKCGRAGKNLLRSVKYLTTLIRTLHIINDLSVGGTEMMLYKLLYRTDRTHFDPRVITLREKGRLSEQIKSLGIEVKSLGINSHLSCPAAAWRLSRLVRRLDPDLIQGWMYHGSLAAQLAAYFSPRQASTVWGIRRSLYSLHHEKRMTALAIRVCGLMSKRPDRIVYNSRVSAQQHEGLGYCPEKTLLIPNGFDTDVFAPSAEARAAVRSELGVSMSTPLVGHFARYHPAKDHQTFLNAAALLKSLRPDVVFMLVGTGVEWSNPTLRRLLRDLQLEGAVHLLGERQDVPRLMAALDLVVSSSREEGFPNVVGEAMACALPCVATAVSDLPAIVDGTGLVVPPESPSAMAAAIAELLALEPAKREALGVAARQRVLDYFQLEAIEALYEALYQSVVVQGRFRSAGYELNEEEEGEAPSGYPSYQ
jgi:glycosyltransferase involved in cell wall biosynthesis